MKRPMILLASTASITRLFSASSKVAAVLDSGERDPTWGESQELENAALAVGREINKARARR